MSICSDNIAELLKQRFPKFADEIEFDDGPYTALGDFALHLRDGFDADSFSPDELRDIFQFLGELGESSDSEIQNLLVVAVLEVLTDSDKAIELSRQQLKGTALGLLERVLSGWNNA